MLDLIEVRGSKYMLHCGLSSYSQACLQESFVTPHLIVLNGVNHHHLSFCPTREALRGTSTASLLGLLLDDLIHQVDAWDLL